VRVKQVDVPCPVVQNPRSLKGPGVSVRFVPNGPELRGLFVCKGKNSGAKFNLQYGSRFSERGLPNKPTGELENSLGGERSNL
jgi:hypothetical protein